MKISKLAKEIEQCHKDFGGNLSAMVKAHVAAGRRAKQQYAALSTSLGQLRRLMKEEEATAVQMDLARTVRALRAELAKVRDHEGKLEKDVEKMAKLVKSFTGVDYR